MTPPRVVPPLDELKQRRLRLGVRRQRRPVEELALEGRADITYVPTLAGFLYLAIVLDVFSRSTICCRNSAAYGAQPRRVTRSRQSLATRPLSVVAVVWFFVDPEMFHGIQRLRHVVLSSQSGRMKLAMVLKHELARRTHQHGR